MATKSLHISEVYASQLEEFRQGHPLWCPSGPEGADEIDLGDIGYIWEGQFVELFKGKYARDHPANAKNRQYNRIPPSHERLPERAYIRPLRSTRDMEPDMYTTKSMKHQKIQPSAGAEIPGVAGVNAKYTLITTEEKAAFLYITHKATKTIIENSIAFKNYVKQYHSAWLEHARNELGIDLRGRDIIMVHGFVKTVEWIVGASRGGSVEQGGSVELQGGVPMVVGKVALELETKVAKAPQMFYLSGPEERIAHSRSPSPSIASFRNSVTEEHSHSRHFSHSTLEVPQPQVPALKVSSEEPKYDQCIFLRYFQVKWRIGAYLHIKAGAGPHQLPRGPDSGGEGSSAPAVSDSGSESDVESNLPSQPTHTWLDILLEYLLQHSDAEVAIACHGDIYSLTLEEEIVEDFAEYLERTRPKIDVDQDKVATLDIVDLVMKQRERELRGINSSLKGKDNDTMDTDPDEPDDEDKDESWRGSDREISDGELVCGHPPTTYKWLHFSLSGKDGDAGYISSVALSPNGTLVAAGCLDGATQLWRTKTGQLVRVLEGHHAETVWSVGFSPDGNLLASGDTEGAVLVRAANDIPHVANTFAQGEHAGVRLGDVLFNLEGHSSDVTALVFSPNGKWLASGSIDCTSKLWPISLEGHGGGFPIVMQARHTLDSLSAHVSNVAFTPDSKRIVLSGDTAVKVWDVESGNLIATMSGHTGPIWSLALSHEGERLATGSEDHTTRIWDTESGTELVIIAEQGGPVWSVAWSEDDKYVLSGSYDSTAMVCDSFTGGVVREFKEPTSGATPVIWLTSDIVCTGTADGPVKLWDLTSGECLAALHGHEDKIKDLLPSSDGRDIISYSDDGSIRIWNVSQVLRLV